MARSCSRRRLLACGATGLTSGLAGCSGTSYGINPGGDGDADPDSDGDDRRPTEPAIEIQDRDGDTFQLRDLPVYEKWYRPTAIGSDYGTHPDSRVITAAVEGRTLSITIENARLVRDLTLTAKRYDDGNPRTFLERTLSPESDSFQTYEWTFDLETGFPLNKGGHIKLLLSDTSPHSNNRYLLKDHQFVGIPYENADTTRGVRWLNDEALNYNPTGSGIDIDPPERLYTETIDTSDGKTQFLALTYPHEDDKIYGAYTNVSESRYNAYQREKARGGEWSREHHPLMYLHNAEDFEMFTSLANSFATSLDANDVTDDWDRLQKLAHLVGCIKYKEDGYNHPQVYTLWNLEADCTQASTLYGSLLNTDAFNHVRVMLFGATIVGVGEHMVVGLDYRDIDPPSRDGIHWLYNDGTNEFPETRYAVTELTAPRDIGDWDTETGKLKGIVDTTELHVHPELR